MRPHKVDLRLDVKGVVPARTCDCETLSASNRFPLQARVRSHEVPNACTERCRKLAMARGRGSHFPYRDSEASLAGAFLKPKRPYAHFDICKTRKII